MLQEPIKPIIEHPAYSELLILLSDKNYNAYALSEKINKSPQAIHKQLTYLKYKKWTKLLRKKDNSSPVNYEKIAEEFLKHILNIYDQAKVTQEQKIQETNIHNKKYLLDYLNNIIKLKTNIDFKLIIKEKFFHQLIKEFLIFYNKKQDFILIKNIYIEINNILISWMTSESFDITKTKEEHYQFKKQFPESYKLITLLILILEIQDSNTKKRLIKKILFPHIYKN